MKVILLTPPQAFKRIPAGPPRPETYPRRGLSSGNKRPRMPNRNMRLKRGLLPPLGIAYLASVLGNAGHEVRLVDSPVYGYTYEDVLAECQTFEPNFIGISTMTPVAESAYTTARMLKEFFPEVPLVMGGAHPTCYPSETLNEIGSEIDGIVVGEGENAILELVHRAEHGESFEGIPGVLHSGTGGKPNTIPVSEASIDLENLPFPARDLLPILRYAPEPYENKRLPSTNVIVSRGCTWSRCTFCERSGMMKRKYRYQSPEKTIEEVKRLIKDFGVRELVFYDDELLSNKRFVYEFCELLHKENIRILWSARGLTMNVNYDLLKTARDAGLWAVFFGFESGDQELLDRIKKGNTVQQSIDAAHWCHELGIEIIGSFILALPGETPEMGRTTIEFAKKINCDYAAFIPLHPYAGTEIYEECRREGTMLEETYDDKMVNTRFIPKISYIPEGYESAEQIEELVKQAYKEFYLRPSYIWQHVKKVRDFQDFRRYLNGFSFVLKLLQH